MDSREQTGENSVEKISVLNEIFENVISDASDLIKDLYWSVKTYLLFGLITILFGVQTLVYNIDSIQEQLYIPLFVAGTMLFAGAVQILNYFRLRKKYSRLFKVQNELKKA
jgi:Ca2+/Na+ antiporter